MRGRALLTGALAAAVFIVGSTGAAWAKGPERVAPSDGEWLFKHTAKHATLRPIGRTGALRLTLRGTSPMLRAVARVPEGSFDFLTLAEFVRSWRTFGFARVAPNAAIAAGKRVLLARLSSPRLTHEGMLSYVVKPLHGKAPGDLRHFAPRVGDGLPSQLGSTSVFLDDADDAPVQVTLGWNSPQSWLGSLEFSSPSLQEINFQGTSLIYTQSGSSFTLNLPQGTNADVPGEVVLLADPVGQCVMVRLDNLNPGTVTGQASGPVTNLQDGMNAIPTSSSPCPI